MQNSVVLVVEDEPDLNELIGVCVRIAGFTYRRAFTGKAAVQEARDVPCSLIVLDLMLPDINGFEVCRLLKADVATVQVPIIFVSAMDDTESRRHGLQSGAVGFLGKPFEPVRLIEAMRVHARKPA